MDGITSLVQADGNNMTIINVHLEPALNQRNLRGRLQRISMHWPRYPDGFGIVIGDFNICEPDEGRFHVLSRASTEGDTGKNAIFRSVFPHAQEIAQPSYTRKDATADGSLCILSRIDSIY